MKRKICFVLGTLLLILPLALFGVQAAQDEPPVWAAVRYVYDAQGEEAAKSGTLSFAKTAKNYMRRYTTLSWNVSELELSVNDTPCTEGTYYVWKAGEYRISVREIATGERAECRVTMLPVVKMGGEYLSVNGSTGEFWRTAFNSYPVIECENVDRIELDRKSVASGVRAEGFGQHLLKFVSGSYATSFYFDVLVCLAQKRYDEALGKNCLVLEVGDFGADFSLLLDGVTPLEAGEHKITALGQHALSGTLNGEALKNSAYPSPKELNLQVQLVIEDFDLTEPMTIKLSRWDADFYVNGERIEGDLRVERDGTCVLTAFDRSAEQIENAFLVQKTASDAGTQYSELVLTFDNPHLTYAIFLIVPAVLMVAAAAFFLFGRRRIV